MSIDTSVGRVEGVRVSIDTSVQVSGQGSVPGLPCSGCVCAAAFRPPNGGDGGAATRSQSRLRPRDRNLGSVSQIAISVSSLSLATTRASVPHPQ